MLSFALNHMTVASLGFEQMLDVARRLGCVGVECRNDLAGKLFDGLSPQRAGEMVTDAGLRLLTLAEIKNFDRLTAGDMNDVISLMDTAEEAKAEAVSLIPSNDGKAFDLEQLISSLDTLLPHLKDRNLQGLIEPLGFSTCGIRQKQPVINVIERGGYFHHFKLVHDTFHHCVANDNCVDAAHTGLVHLSGVVDRDVSVEDMLDSHRVLVSETDRLGNVAQIARLLEQGFEGPFSFEAFSPELHAEPNIVGELEQSMKHITATLLKEAA